MGRLTTVEVRTVGPGRYSDGGTLTLLVSRTGGRSWVQRLTINGKRADIGLGGWPVVSLAKARRRAFEHRVLVSDGGDPRAEKRKALMPTFREAAVRTLEANRGAWKSDKTAAAWRVSLERAYKTLGDLPVNQIDRGAVLRALEPVMLATPAAGRRMRQTVRAVLAWAQAHGYVNQNAAGAAIDAALPKAPAVKAHRKALEYGKVGEALARVEVSSSAPAVRWCLWFVVVTACRSGEARGATWNEIDTERREWRIPGERMKSGREHRVPLSDAALAVLDWARALDDGSGLVFPSPAKPGAPLSDVALIKVLKRAGVDCVPHGFRSSFRDWASEQTDAPHAVCEMALSHSVGSAVERSYARSDLFAKRRTLMGQWAAFVTGARS